MVAFPTEHSNADLLKAWQEIEEDSGSGEYGQGTKYAATRMMAVPSCQSVAIVLRTTLRSRRR